MAQAEEYREKLMDEVAEVSESLMERYLEGEEISHDEIVTALKDGTNHGDIFPVTCGVATRNLGDQPAARRDRRGPPVARSSTAGSRSAACTLEPSEDAELFAYVFKTRADPFAGRINLFRVYQGVLSQDSQVLNTPLAPQGAHRPAARLPRQGDRARRRVRPRRHRRGRQAQGDAGRRLAGGPRRADRDAVDHAARAGHGLRDRAEGQGRRGQGVHRPAPAAGGGPDDRPAPRRADRRADRRRPVADPRRGDRRPPEATASAPRSTLKPPRVPYQETIRRPAQGARAPQEADRRPRPVRRLPHRDRAARARRRASSSWTRSRAASSRTASSRRWRRACARRWRTAPVAGLSRSRTSACGSSTAPTTRSTRRRWRSRSRARSPCRRRWPTPTPALLEPIMIVTLSVPEDSVGDVIGDLNSRRGRPQGMEPSAPA